MSASSFIGDIIYGLGVLEFIGLEQPEAVRLDIDCKPASDVAQDYSASTRTKHLERRDFRVREASFRNIVRIRRVPSAQNVADIFTKMFTAQSFRRLRGWVLGNASVASTSVASLVSALHVGAP